MEYLPLPNWWIILTGAFAAVNLIFFMVLAYCAIQLVKVVKNLEPKVHAITDKVDGIAAKVDDIASTTQETLKTVSVKTKSIATTAEAISQMVAGPVQQVSPWFKYLGLAFSVFRFLMKAKKSMPKKPKKA